MSQLSEFLTCKRILVVLFFLGFMLHHMLRINMSMAVIDMISNRSNMTEVQRFDWSEEQKNDILGCFCWGYTVTSLVSGHLSEVYGTRIILGSGVVLATICTLLTPLVASHLSYICLILLRVGVGFGLGMQWSSVMPIATKWIPPTDISKFLSTILGSQLGAAITFIVCGYLIKAFGWPSVFYVTGAFSAIWCLAWFYCVYDSPIQHPRISEDEQKRLLRKVKYQANSVSAKKPWAKIMTSRPVWAIIIAMTCINFNTHSVANYMPLYMNQVLNFNISANGLLSSLPYFATYFTAVLSSFLADKWNKSGYVSLLVVRQIFTVGALWIAAFSLTVESVWGYNYVVSVVFFTLWQSSAGYHSGGSIPNAVDISPNYSALLVTNEENFQEWRIFFWIISAANVVAAVVYHIFASAEVQEWNNTSVRNEVEQEYADATELYAVNAKPN
ncbi:sialin-like [Zophobas morio]|uniref:sialin-like n=1 Tax=Zophobas morio TaxID=2755281 RepID=UPI003083B52A